MPSLTIAGISDETLARLRDMTAAQRRSLNQHVISVLERAAREQDGFARAYSAFLERRADLPQDGPEEFFPERDASPGREAPSFE